MRRLLGYLPQEFGVYPKVTGRSISSTTWADSKGLSEPGLRRQAVEALLQKTNLWEARNRALGTFSGGMKQRFGIAQALIGDPRLLIVDEPTAGLDPEERVRFHDLLSEISQSVIVILSTHIVSDVSDLCSQMAIMHQGQLRLVQEPNAAVAGLRGRLWERRWTIGRAGPDGCGACRSSPPGWSEGRTRVRVLADRAPEQGFTTAEPELEDVYFAVRRGLGSVAKAA